MLVDSGIMDLSQSRLVQSQDFIKHYRDFGRNIICFKEEMQGYIYSLLRNTVMSSL